MNISLGKVSLAGTEQNNPLFVEVPATTLGGYAEENNHNLKEMWDSKHAHLNSQLALLTALTLVGASGQIESLLTQSTDVNLKKEK